MTRSLLYAVLLAAGPLSARAVTPQDLAWVNSAADRIAGIHNPVIAAWATARMAAITCPVDKSLGSALFRKAIARLRELPEDAFDDSRTVLPVGTFTTLWKLTVPAALQCNPDVVAPEDRVNWKLTAERGRVRIWLRRSRESDDPDRAAQLIDAALAVAEPGYIANFLLDVQHGAVQDTRVFMQNHEYPLDVANLLEALIHLRVDAPDLADGLFQKAIDFVMATPPVPVNRLSALGAYLFIAPKDMALPDPGTALTVVKYPSDRAWTNQYLNLMAVRASAGTDAIASYMASALRLLQATESVRYYGLESYALAYNLQPKAARFAPQSQSDLDSILANLAAQLGAKVGLVQAALGPPLSAIEPPDEAGRNRDFALVTRVRAEISAGRFDSARNAQQSITDDRVRAQLESIVAFGETAQALESKQYQRSFDLTAKMAPGLKRALSFASNVSNPDRTAALGAMRAGVKDSEALPPNSRTCALSALAYAATSLDADEALAILQQLIAASNDALGSPRAGFHPNAESFADPPYILCGESGVSEVVAAGGGRQTFDLRLPAVPGFALETVLPHARGLDFGRVEALVQQLRDDYTLARAMIGLVRLRLSTTSSLEAARE